LCLCFVFPNQRSSFATASDDWWQSQVLHTGHYYRKLDYLHWPQLQITSLFSEFKN